MPMLRLFVLAVVMIQVAGQAHAVSLRKVISACSDDSGRYCKGVGYGDPMQACLLASRDKLEPQCRAIVDRIAAGEKVTLF